MLKLLPGIPTLLILFTILPILLQACPENETITNTNNIQEPFLAGQTVEFCFDFDFNVGANPNCQWLSGVVPIFGDCWDASNFDGSGASISSPNNNGTWDWWEECDLVFDPNNNQVDNTTWGTYTNLSNGLLSLCNINGTIPGCTLLSSGDCLPGGWYFTGAEGSFPGGFNPNETWGDGIECNGSLPFTFCFEISTLDSNCDELENCSISFHTFSDGEIGDWVGAVQTCPNVETVLEEYDFSCFDPLPLQLTDFNGTVNNGTGYLNWETENERNFSHYELEYGTNGADFTLLSRIEGKGNNQNFNNKYTYQDYNNSNAEVVYYRLKMIDFDGQFTYSDVVVLKYEKQGAFELFPNPATDHVIVQHPSNVETGRLELYNATGKLLYAKQISSNETFTTIQLDVCNAGVHFLRYVTELESETLKFVVE